MEILRVLRKVDPHRGKQKSHHNVHSTPNSKSEQVPSVVDKVSLNEHARLVESGSEPPAGSSGVEAAGFSFVAERWGRRLGARMINPGLGDPIEVLGGGDGRLGSEEFGVDDLDPVV